MTFGPNAGAQNAARGRGEYTMVTGGANGTDAGIIYIADVANQEVIAMQYNGDQQVLEGVGYRNLAADAENVVKQSGVRRTEPNAIDKSTRDAAIAFALKEHRQRHQAARALQHDRIDRQAIPNVNFVIGREQILLVYEIEDSAFVILRDGSSSTCFKARRGRPSAARPPMQARDEGSDRGSYAHHHDR